MSPNLLIVIVPLLTNYKHMFSYMKWESLKANQILSFERATNATFLWFLASGTFVASNKVFTSNEVCPFLLHGFVQKISESLVLVKVRFSDFWQSFIWDWIVQLNREKLYLQVLSWCALAKLEGVAPSLSKEAESKMTLTRTQRHVKIGIGLRSYMATASGLAPFCSRSLTNWSLPW